MKPEYATAGDFVRSSIKADGGVSSEQLAVSGGNGGTVILWTDQKSAVYGDLRQGTRTQPGSSKCRQATL